MHLYQKVGVHAAVPRSGNRCCIITLSGGCMHAVLRSQDKNKEDDMQVTEDLAARMPRFTQEEVQPLQELMVNQPPASPGADLLSPLPMDLTNNSFDLLQLQQQQHHVHPPAAGPSVGQPEFTKNITLSIPALSTLVEEDEEAGLETGGSVLQQSRPPQGFDVTASMELTGQVPEMQGMAGEWRALQGAHV